MKALIRTVLAIFALGSVLSAMPIANPPGLPIATKPEPSVVNYAAAHRIPVAGIELARDGESVRPNDRLIVLFTVQENGQRRQWLGEFCTATLTEREAKSKPGTGLGILSVLLSSLHTDTGHKFSFESSPAALEISTHGPFSEADAKPKTEPVVTHARVLATRDYLTHGLAPMGEIELRLRAAGKKNPGLSFMYRPKYSDPQVAAAKARSAEAGFTEDDERVYAESIFALVQFASLAFRTEGVNAILSEIADSPTLFSGAFVNLDWNRLQLENGGDWGLPAAHVFRLPYTLDSKTKVGGSFFLTAPQPPLQNSAGIIGLTVDWTSKTPGKRLIMRVLAGRRGAP